jgi:outer membrane receptor for ferrienterochelin and colicins
MKLLHLYMLVLSVLASGPCGGLFSAAHAQILGGEGDLAELSLEELMHIPVYAASRYAQDMSDAPASVTIITGRDIKAYGYCTLAEVLSSVPGFYMSCDRSYEYAGMRGFSRPGDFNTRILLLIDGVRTNEVIYDSSGLGADFNIDVDLIDRIEIVRGPGSVVFGTNAFFAVINVITKTGRDFDGGKLSLSAASFDARKGSLSYGGPLKKRGEFLVSGSYGASDGQDFYFPEFDSPGTNRGISAGLDGEHFGNVYGKVRYGGWGLGLALMEREKYRPTAAYETIFGNDSDRDLDRRFMADVSYRRELGGGGEGSAHLTFQDYAYDGYYLFASGEEGDSSFSMLNMDRVRGQWWGGEVKLYGEIFAHNRVTAGAEYRDNFKIDQENFDVGTSAIYLDSRRSSRITSVYAQDEIRFTKRLILSVGARCDHAEIPEHIEPVREWNISPRTALILKPFSRTSLKLIYGEAFRNPNAFELYYNDGGNTTKSNPGLDPERIRTYEAVVTREISNELQGKLALYRYNISGLVSQRLDPSDGLLQYWNMGAVQANGLEVTIDGKAPGIIEGRLSYSYTDALYSASQARLGNSPRHVAKLNVMTPLFHKMRAAFETQYVGARLTLGGRTAKAYAVANLTITAKRLLGRFDISAGARNLFDTRYAYPVGEELIQDALEADGRTFRVKCTYVF